MHHELSDNQENDVSAVRQDAYDLGESLLAYCPECRERSLAMTKLEECLMWAVKAIALNEE